MLALASSARAEDADDVTAYREAIARASASFNTGDYAAARDDFDAAYQIHPEPLLRFNIASTYRREGDLESAIAEYRAFLAEAAANHPKRALAIQTIAELERQIELRDAPPEPPPEPEPVVEEPAPAPPRRARTRSLPRAPELMRWGGLACGAASIVTLGAALVAVRDASSAERELEALPPGQSWDGEQQALYDEGRSARRNAILWSVATAALAGTGVALYVYGDRRETALTVTPSSEGAMVTAAGRF